MSKYVTPVHFGFYLIKDPEKNKKKLYWPCLIMRKIFKTVHSFIRNAWLLNLLTFFSVFFGVKMLHHDLLFKMLGCSPPSSYLLLKQFTILNFHDNVVSFFEVTLWYSFLCQQKWSWKTKGVPGKGENLFVTPRQQTNLII